MANAGFRGKRSHSDAQTLPCQRRQKVPILMFQLHQMLFVGVGSTETGTVALRTFAAAPRDIVKITGSRVQMHGAEQAVREVSSQPHILPRSSILTCDQSHNTCIALGYGLCFTDTQSLLPDGTVVNITTTTTATMTSATVAPSPSITLKPDPSSR